MTKAGDWLFIDKATGNRTTAKLKNADSSTIKAAFDAAKATLSPASNNTLFGYDSRGTDYRYTSTALGKKFDR
jgi:hypothetical protein